MVKASYLMADAHVHFYEVFDQNRFLDSAISNFRRWARQLHLPPGTPGMLLLSERAHEHYFVRWTAAGGEAAGGRWSFRETGDECALIARRNDGAKLYIVAGRQIATVEGLEILALASTREFGDGRPFRETLDSVLKSAAITVLPWGFGKWSFGRGARVSDVIESANPDQLFLGDNANRLRWGPRPKLFDAANARGIRILPGSDPLPFAYYSNRAGSCGFAVPAALDEERPAQSLRRTLLEHDAQPLIYGRLESLPRFCMTQIALQWKKRVRSRSTSGSL